MNTSFLICGYPRSRTLWLSQFLTIPGFCRCEHEASQFAASSDEFWNRADCFQEPIYGNSDSAQLFVLPALLARRPLTKVIWVDRPMCQVEASLRAAGFPWSKEEGKLLALHRKKYQDMFDVVVSYDRLGKLEVMLSLWNFLFGCAMFDYGRWGIMEGTKIAYTYQDYLERPRDTSKLMNFIKTEGEAFSCFGEKNP
jgi:hypothetical protein